MSAIACIGWLPLGAPDPASTVAVAPGRAVQEQVPAAATSGQAEVHAAATADSIVTDPPANADNAERWSTLARSQAALGRHAAAVAAFRRAVGLRPDDATLLADYAFSAAVLDADAAYGESAWLVAQALRLEPANPKALALAGTLALDRKDYRTAVDHWEQLARVEAPGTAQADQLQYSILQARRLAAGQGTSPPGTAAALANRAGR